MKNYLVKVLFDFNDIEEKTEAGTDTPRKTNDVFNCTKERYEYLKSKNAVMLVGIDEVKEEPKKEVVKETNSKTNVYNNDKMCYNNNTSSKKGRKKKEV